MSKHLLLTFAAFCIVGGFLTGTVAHARDTGIAGTLTKVEPRLIQVTTDSEETVLVTVTADTDYLKWIMAKPWQQDIRIDARTLHVGQRVHVDLSSSNPMTARTVWVVTGRVGFPD